MPVALYCPNVHYVWRDIFKPDFCRNCVKIRLCSLKICSYLQFSSCCSRVAGRKSFNLWAPKYFSEQYRCFNDGNLIGKGYKQIKTFKDHCFSDDVIQNKLKNSGLAGASEKNSAFLVVHTMPFLNFYEHDGIVFYEWNTFRSILNGGVQLVEINKELKEVKVGFEGEFENPDVIIDGYFNEEWLGPSFKNAYQIFRSMVCMSKIENYSLYSKML